MPELIQIGIRIRDPNRIGNRHGLSADEMRSLCDRILSFAKADNTRVNIESGMRGFTRTATNRITTAGTTSDVTIRVMSVFGKRAASVETNRLDAASLARTVRECEDLARISPENPEYLPELGAQTFAAVNGYYSTTGDLTTESRARAAAIAIKAAEGSKAIAAGFIDVRAGSQAVATSKGLFAYDAGTGVASTLTVRTLDGSSSGWAGDEGADWATIESERIAEDAVRKCQQWRGKRALEPGKYDVVLEPTAVGMLMLRMQGTFDARQADEGRSYFSRKGGGNRVGDKLFDERVTIISDPASRNAETSPFTGAGLPVTREVWVENGVLKNLSYSRFWAEQKQVAPKAPPAQLDHVRRRCQRRRHDHVGEAWRAAEPLLVHPWAQPAHHLAYGSHPRRDVSDRERKDQPAGDEFPVQSIARRAAPERGDAGSPDACRRQRKQFGRRADCCASAHRQRILPLERQRRNLTALRALGASAGHKHSRAIPP